MTGARHFRFWQGAYWALALSLCVSRIALAETLPTKGKVDSRIRTALYSGDEVYRLYGWAGYDIELIFEEGEVFEGKGGGDLEGVTIEAFENQVHLKPKAALVATNLVIYTNRRAYRFDYSVSARRPNLSFDEVMYAVRFTYPPTKAVGRERTASEEVDLELARADEHRRRNYDYWFCGQPSIKPIAASDDGIHTRLTFAARSELPALFVRNDDGSESLLNFSLAEGDVVIHRVAPRFILRRGRLTGCIVNKAFSGSGERLDSGTLAPDVERVRKDPRP